MCNEYRIYQKYHWDPSREIWIMLLRCSQETVIQNNQNKKIILHLKSPKVEHLYLIIKTYF